MAEVKDPIVQESDAIESPETDVRQQADHDVSEVSAGKKNRPPMSKKKKKWLRRGIALVVVAAVILGIVKFAGGGSDSEMQVVTDVVQYGAITAKVEGSGLTKAKSNEVISVTTPGTVLEVLVTEGQEVQAGDLLFKIDSPAAETAVQKARSTVEGYEKQISLLERDIAGLNLSAPYPGKLLEVVDLNPGDQISKGMSVATLADDTRMRLEQYYSYAYAGEIQIGQTMEVSIPALMTTVSGHVEEVHMVSRITPEGSKLFCAQIVIENEGVLAAEMVASATATVNGEEVYPYEAGKLEYYRTGQLESTVNGTVISSSLVDYLQVSSGQVLVYIDGEDSESEMFSLQQSLDSAREELEKAEKNLANCNAVAPIGGKIIGLSAIAGSEVNTQSPLVTISDTKSITVNATVDERNIGYIKPGMMVELDQWGTMTNGVVESVSLSSTVTNGVATYPMVISADNYDNMLQVNSNINYSLVASQNDNCLVLPIQCVRTVSLEDGSAVTVVYVSGERPENAIDVPMMFEEIPDGFWAVPVEIGISDSYHVEIKSGVEEGTEVFTQIQTMEVWG